MLADLCVQASGNVAGGYEDDQDEGEWFFYTGSGGRDLSGNKRTNKVQSSDQTFDSFNEALQTSCERGLPVRVLRSSKDKNSAYAPPVPKDSVPTLRYDGLYKIVCCWRSDNKDGALLQVLACLRCLPVVSCFAAHLLSSGDLVLSR